jgi:hypothetical protein
MTSGWEAWGAPPEPVARVPLAFNETKSKKGLTNFSAGTRLDDSLFLAADEHVDIDRLTLGADGCDRHERFALADFLPLADPEEEADLEGLAADDGWLWVVGSHARTRAKPEKEEDERIDLQRLADLKDTRARCLLARLPLVRDGAGWRPVAKDGERQAGMLTQNEKGNAIARALARNPLLKPFTHVPAKEGGIDVEGIAVCGDRVALGMRGPVVGGHALLIEFELTCKASGKLKLSDDPVVRLLAMEGLGVRDLKRCGDDLLILAGPTTGLDGPCALYRWRGWAGDPPQDDRIVRLHRPERVMELPFGRGVDHPEGLALWDGGRRVLVIYDSPAPWRVDLAARTVEADLFDLLA